MVGSNLITETDAVKQAGVSARTLHRFSEAGYLTVQVATDGHRLYSETQLQEIFGSFSGPTPTEDASVSEEVESCATTPCGDVKTNFRPSQEETTYYSEAPRTPMVEKVAPQEKQETKSPKRTACTLKSIDPPL